MEVMRYSRHASKARIEVTEGREDAHVDFTLTPGHTLVGRITPFSENTSVVSCKLLQLLTPVANFSPSPEMLLYSLCSGHTLPCDEVAAILRETHKPKTKVFFCDLLLSYQEKKTRYFRN